MARPKVNHDGFLIPNAGDVANPKMAEPDRIDFNTVGNDRWGVVKDCLVTVAGATATTSGGIAVVDGELVVVKGGSALLGVGAAQDRFDLVVTDVGGTLKVIPGAPSADAVFPDPGPEYTILCAVFCPAGSSNLADFVIDKRNWLSDSLQTKIDPTSPLIRNLNGTGDEFLVTGDGHQVWHGDAHIYRVAVETLRIIKHLMLDGNLVAGGDISGVNLAGSGTVTGSNLVRGDSLPGTGNPGDIFQHELSGRIYVYVKDEGWQELATLAGAVPVGSVITSMVDPGVMRPMGWIPLDGGTINEAQFPELFAIPALVASGSLTGVAPNRALVMPDASRRVLLTDFNNPGVKGGRSSFVLSPANLPPHNHAASASTGMAGQHDHPVNIAQGGAHAHTATSGGEHGHAVSDPGHSHNGADFFGSGAAVIAAVWGGRNKLDALFNDKSHTYNVEPVPWMSSNYTGISISGAGSGHGHAISQDAGHSHGASVGSHPGHSHPLNLQSVGEGAPVSLDPPYITVYTYIRS